MHCVRQQQQAAFKGKGGGGAGEEAESRDSMTGCLVTGWLTRQIPQHEEYTVDSEKQEGSKWRNVEDMNVFLYIYLLI